MEVSRPKGGNNRKWTDEDRARIIARYMEEGISYKALAREEDVPLGTMRQWINRYMRDGEEGLVNKRKTGNLYAALHTNENLSELDRLRLLVLRQEIEIERLKKGYTVEGVGGKKVFVMLNDRNTKSSKP